MNWIDRIEKLVNKPEDSPFPLAVFEIRPPTKAGFPPELPSSETFRRFYGACDGGTFGTDCTWYSSADLLRENRQWFKTLSGYEQDGASPLREGQHLVFAKDAAGAPYIWDACSLRVATFYFKGGDWEPAARTIEEFLEQLLFPAPEDRDDLWYEALSQLP